MDLCQQWTRACMPCSYKPALVETTTVTAATAETCHPPSQCWHPLFSLQKLSQTSMNASGWNIFHVEEFSSIRLLHLHFHVRCYSVRVPLCCHLSHSNNMPRNAGGKVQPLLLSHQQSPLTSWADIKQEALLSEQPSYFTSLGSLLLCCVKCTKSFQNVSYESQATTL